MGPHFSDEQIADIKGRTDIADLAMRLGAVLRRRGTSHIGSCPMCGGGKRATRFKVDARGWACAVCSDGGDVIRLVQRATSCSFAAAIDYLGGTRELSDAEKRALKDKREREEKARAAEQARYRKREFDRCVAIRSQCRAVSRDSVVGRYLDWRHIVLPQSALVREHPNLAYFDGEVEDARGFKSPRKLHEGPAMVADFVGPDGAFTGLHITWLAGHGGGKAQIVDPETGEVLPSKKMRGHKLGSHLVLRHVENPSRLFMGEGIETTLSVAVALHATGRLRAGDEFWAAGDLGNLGGPHAGMVDHTTLKTDKGRALRIPGPRPGDGEAIVIPPSVSSLVLLGDGDSERELTRHAMERGRARYARAGLTIATAMAADGADFNNMLGAA